MDENAYMVRSGRVVAEGRVGPGVVWVRGGKIERVELGGREKGGSGARFGEPGYPEGGMNEPGYAEMDVGDLVVMPGLVDTHVHVNEPGRTEWEGFATAGRAAAAGGVTTMVVMPLNCTPAATTVEALMGEARAASGTCLVDYGFWGGLVPGNVGELEGMWEAGALGFKCFMVESGVEDFGWCTRLDIEAGAPVLARLGAPLLVHAEDPWVLGEAAKTCGLTERPRAYARYVASRPIESEAAAIRMLAEVSRKFGLHVHAVHVSGMMEEVVRATGASDGRLTAETCPHYLVFAAEDIGDGATQYKCAPPIREFAHSCGLWAMLGSGVIGMIVSDHSPCPPQMKELETGSFAKAWGGISSLQLGLSAVWTCANGGAPTPVTMHKDEVGSVMRRDDWTRFGLQDVARWMCETPARLAGIAGRKGSIAAGKDADLVIFDPEAEWTVRGEELQHRHALTPYDGMTLRGVVKRTILRGRTIYEAKDAGTNQGTEAGRPCRFSEPIGQWIKRDTWMESGRAGRS